MRAHEILGTKPGCSTAEAKKAFAERIRRLHPDKGGNDASAVALIEAYQKLRALANDGTLQSEELFASLLAQGYREEWGVLVEASEFYVECPQCRSRTAFNPSQTQGAAIECEGCGLVLEADSE